MAKSNNKTGGEQETPPVAPVAPGENLEAGPSEGPSATDDNVEPPKVETHTDLARAQLRAAAREEAAAKAAAERAKRNEELTRASQLRREAKRLAERAPEGYGVYRVDPGQKNNVVLRGRCFRPGDLFLATADEARSLVCVQPFRA